MKCEHKYEWSKHCGVEKCILCKDHKGLTQCYCGWNSWHGKQDEEFLYECQQEEY